MEYIKRYHLVAWCGLLIFCSLTTFAAGYGFDVGNTWQTSLIGTVGTLLFFIILSWASIKWASHIFLFYAISIALYFPIGWLYGSPTFKVVGALLETDVGEAIEFLHNMPISVWIAQIAFGLFALLVWKNSKMIFEYTAYWHKKAKIYIAILFLVLFIAPLMASFLREERLQEDESIIPITVIGFYVDAVIAPKIYWTRKQELLEMNKKPSTWHIQNVQPKYKNYVIVIGESARADYMNAYGFKLPNTPFMSKTNGLLIDGYISAAEMTMASVPTTLSFKNQSNNNVVTLAKQAGFSTNWLSNQGMLGFFAATISSFAIRSDYVYFTQRGEYQKSVGLSDRKLLPELQKVLNQPTDKPRLIVLHIMGSHSDFCKRLENGVQFKYENKSLSCYVSSIYETDKLLEQIVDILKKNQESYSLIYFSDHGLKHVGKGDEKTLIHGGDTYETFAVPFAKISSDDSEHKVIKVQRSAFNFIYGFSQWTGIQVAELPQTNDFFGTQPDIPNRSNNLERVNSLSHDPVSQK
jgi:hypothetical protein